MNLTYLSLSIGLFVVLVGSIIIDLVLGNRGKQNNASDLYMMLKGEKKSKEILKVSRRSNLLEKLLRKNILYSIPICFSIFVISLAAFKSIGMAAFVSLFGLVFPKVMYNNSLKKRKELVDLQLKDALYSITSSLKAGLSINSAMLKCTDELKKMYVSQKEKPMLEEFEKIRDDLSMGLSVDDALRNFKDRVKTEDAEDFANSIIIVRQKGGNLVQVVDNVSKMINDKITIKREIQRITAGKKMEAKIISVLPVFIVISLSIFSPQYMQPLYGSTIGKIIIVFGFVLLVANYFIGLKIVDIRI